MNRERSAEQTFYGPAPKITATLRKYVERNAERKLASGQGFAIEQTDIWKGADAP